MDEERTQAMKKALIEAVINGLTAFALALGTLILGKASTLVRGDISVEYMILLATGFGLVRFASYMYQNEDDVTPGDAVQNVLPTGKKRKGRLASFFSWCGKHQVGKII
jgi:hypothetical protein